MPMATNRKRAREEEDLQPGAPRKVSPIGSSGGDLRDDDKYRKSMYLAFVRDALRKKAQGDTAAYEELAGRFNSSTALTDSGSAQELRLLVSALCHVVSQLDRHHSTLVDAVLSLPWYIAEGAFVKSYISLMGMLVSARPEYNAVVLGKAVDGLTFQSGLRALNSGIAEGSTNPLTRRDVYERQHGLLQHVLSLVPTLANTLQPILVRKFPHKRQDKVAQVTYIRNLLRLTEYCSELSDRILATIIERAIQIDVEIQVEIEELEAEEQSAADPLFEFDPFDSEIGNDAEEGDQDAEFFDDDALSDLSSEGGDPDDDAPNVVNERNTAHIQDMVVKLDAILKLIFDHFNNTHAISEPALLYDTLNESAAGSSGPLTMPLTVEQGRNLRRSQFRTLISIFDRTILRTFKSRYTQFLLFWYSSLDPEFTDNFLGLLLNRALVEVDQPSVTRAAAASYVASFVSRAQFVDGESARRVVGLLCAYLSRQLEVFAEVEGPTHIAQYTVFYAVSQAVFLIFCFRWRELQMTSATDELDEEIEMGQYESPGAKKWIPELDVMRRVIISALNPLRVCSQNVVKQFARVAQATGFMYCYSILDSNRRSDFTSSNSSSSVRPSSNTTTRASEGGLLLAAHNAQLKANPSVIRDSAVEADLNSFFPFDPYKLPLSHSYIDGVYREWGSVALDDSDSESDDEGDGSDENGESDGDEDSQNGEEINGGAGIPFQKSLVDIPRSSSAEELGQSFGGMSISPIRHVGSYVAVAIQA